MTTVISVCPETARDPYKAPGCAEEFERQDGPRIRAFTASRLLEYRTQDREDAAAAIFTQMVANEVWLQYEQGHISEHTEKPVTWKYFVNSKVPRYVYGWREKLSRDQHREPLVMDSRVGDGSGSWGEVFGPSHSDSYPSLAGDDSFETLRNWLAVHPPSPAPCSMLELLDALADRARCGEKFSGTVVGRQLGLNPAATKTAMSLLDASLRQAKADPGEIIRVNLGGVDLSAADVRTAIDRLRRSKGNRVLPAWEGHPLENADPKWYILFARDEVRCRPELKLPKGSHDKGQPGGGHTSQVKVALLAGLERELVECGAPEPEPELTRFEIFEAALHRAGLPGAYVESALAAAAEVWPG